MEDIAGEEMRLYLTDLALERARLDTGVPAAFESAQARPRPGGGPDPPRPQPSSPRPATTAATANSPNSRRASRPPERDGLYQIRLISSRHCERSEAIQNQECDGCVRGSWIATAAKTASR